MMRSDTSVLLVDANLQFGDVDAFLNVQSTSSIADLAKTVGDIDQEMIDAGFLQYEKGEDAPVLETLAYGSVPLVSSAAR